MIFTFPTLPSIALITALQLPDIPFNAVVNILSLPLGLVIWYFIAKKLMTEIPYLCEKCGKKSVFTKPVEEGNNVKIYYSCKNCGYEKYSGVAQIGATGG